jgi:hypothetical protein
MPVPSVRVFSFSPKLLPSKT